MISKTQKTVTISGKTERILRFEVWFQSPFGLYSDLDEAVMRVAAADMDIELAIVPVSVAVCETIHEVCGQ